MDQRPDFGQGLPVDPFLSLFGGGFGGGGESGCGCGHVSFVSSAEYLFDALAQF
jgi:hypothetical protein